jgi:hypothetical protein
MGAKHGIDAALYRNTATWGTPTWSEVLPVAELTPGGGWDAAEIKTRQSRVKFGAKVMLDIGFTLRMLCDDADANYTAIMTAFQSLTATLDLLVLDGDITTVGSFGYRALFQVTAGDQPQPVDDVLYRTFKLVPYPDSTNRPQYASITSGPATTLTTI